MGLILTFNNFLFDGENQGSNRGFCIDGGVLWFVDGLAIAVAWAGSSSIRRQLPRIANKGKTTPVEGMGEIQILRCEFRWQWDG